MRRVGFGPDQYAARAVEAADRIEAAGMPRLVAIGAIGGVLAVGVAGDVRCFLESVIRVLTKRMAERREIQDVSGAGPAVVNMAVETLEAIGVTVDQHDEVWVDAPVRNAAARRRQLARWVMSAKYAWEPGMGEISGFGGGYEDACRDMVRAGCEWFDAHPDADPQFTSYRNVVGVCLEDNEDAKALSAAICAAPKLDGSDPTGAMFHATVRAVLFIRKHGWERYVAEMTKREARERSGAPS